MFQQMNGFAFLHNVDFAKCISNLLSSNTHGILLSVIIVIFTRKHTGNLNIKTYVDDDPESHARWHYIEHPLLHSVTKNTTLGLKGETSCELTSIY